MARELSQAWSRFWFEADGRSQMRLFRLAFGLMLAVVYALRTPDLELFYGPQGVISVGTLSEIANMQLRFSILQFLTSRAALWVAHLGMIASLLALAFGWRPRWMAMIALVLHVSFIHRNITAAYGVDLVSCFFLFYLCLADHRQSLAAGDWRATVGSMAYRLFQVQVCIIYAYSGLKKLKGQTWWNGDALWYALANTEIATLNFSWLAHFPLTVMILTFSTLIWEIYFPAAMWTKGLRRPWLWGGVLMHVGIAITLGLPFFGLMMILSYVFFLDSHSAERAFTVISGRLNIFVKSFGMRPKSTMSG